MTRRQRRRAVTLVVVLTLARLTAYGLGRPSAGVANRGYVFGLGAVAAYVLLTYIAAVTVAPQPTAFDELATVTTPPRERPTRLAALEDLAAFGADRAQGLHHHLRPYLRELVADRLALRRIDLDTDPRAPAALSPLGWELLRPDRPEPDHARGPGLTATEVAALTDLLEHL